MKKNEIKVKGMACEGCEKRIKNALSGINEVENVDANYKTGLVVVTTNKEYDLAMLEEKIEDLGFEVAK